MKKKWLKQLSEKSKLLIDDGYTLGPAMTEARYALYDDIGITSSYWTIFFRFLCCF